MAVSKSTLIENASKFLQRGQLERAIRELEKALDLDPDDHRVRMKLAAALVRAGRNADALAHYESVADWFSGRGFDHHVVAICRQIIALDPGKLPPRLRLAEHYRRLGLIAEALAQLGAAADVAASSGTLGGEIDVRRRIVELAPEQSLARRQLAETMIRGGLQSEALVELTSLADELRASKRPDDLLPVLDRIAFLDGSNPELLREIAELHLDHGDPRRALAALQILLRQEPPDRALLMLLRRAFMALGSHDKVATLDQEIARLDEPPAPAPEPEPSIVVDTAPPPVAPPMNETSVSRRLAEAEIFVRYGLWEKALTCLRELVGFVPNDVDARTRLKDVYLALGEVEAAEEQLRAVHAIRLAKGDVEGARSATAELDTMAEQRAQVPIAAQELFVSPVFDVPADPIEILVEDDEPSPSPASTAPIPVPPALELVAPSESEPESAVRPCLSDELAADLDCADFFVRQAIADYRRLLRRHPGNPEVSVRLQRAAFLLDGGTAPAPPPPEPASSKEDVDLLALLKDEELPQADDGALTMKEVLARFRDGVEKHVSVDDSRTHRDLGMAFQGMGLFAEAIDEFRLASADPACAGECAFLIGLCMREQGNPNAAIDSFQEASRLAMDVRSRASAHFEIAKTCRDNGEIEKADVALAEARSLDGDVESKWGRR